MNPAIRVENLGKKYRIRHQQQGRQYKALRDVIAEKVTAPFRKLGSSLGSKLSDIRHQTSASGSPDLRPPTSDLPSSEDFWALNDVSFEIKQGEAVGIIGRNGAGKSTLLKVLSRITEPSKGRIELDGRLASLLEVGTGFHQELTGRENIYLNGAILGMHRAEIKRKFDEIVAFAEVEKFLDTPVKRYSSGMYMRLAFAVAAHLEPEILIVDEVLAVGDAEFQSKCMGKMKSVSKSGRTILFVSHNLQAVRTLCERVMLLEKGRLVFVGESSTGLQMYTDQRKHNHDCQWQRQAESPVAPLVFQAAEVSVVGKQPNLALDLSLIMESVENHNPAFIAVDILDETGLALMQAIPQLTPFVKSDRKIHRLELSISLPPMVPGNYLLTFWAGPHNTYTFDIVAEAIQFEITESPTVGRTVPHYAPDHGYIVPHSTIREG
jgi:lipopolysaccharide transport system ATP-binding protein